jgi:spermidine synthase
MELRASRSAIRRAVAVAGAAALLAQVVLLREILASSHGNELVLGLALFAWLCLTALASALGARHAGAQAVATQRLGLVLGLAPLLLLAALWLTHFAGTNALGQEPSLPAMLLVTFVALLPASALGGLAFAWAAAAVAEERQALAIYVAETVGSAVAGLLFHFLFAEHLAATRILWLAGAAAAAASAAVLWPRRHLVMVPAAATLLALAFSPAVDRELSAARFPGEQVLVVQLSRYGLLAVIERGGQRAFFHDGVLLFTSEDELAAEETTHLPLLLHPRPRRVLMVGGGLGGGLAVALTHQPEVLDYAEMDPAILRLARRFGDARTQAVLADPRVHVANRDARALVREAAGRYDVILVNLPVAQNALLARLSTREFITEARRALAPGGILAFVTPGSDAYLDEAARLRHASLMASLRAVFPAVGVAPGSQTILWASESAIPVRAGDLAQRLRERGVRPLQIGRAWLYDRLLPLHAEAYRRALAATLAVENRDFRPVVYLFGLIEGLERLSPRLGRVALACVRTPWASWLLAAGILGVAAVALLLRRGRGAPGFAAGAAGAAGMALEMVLLLAFQSLVGHLYHALGAMLAAFMTGMAAGAVLGGRFAGRKQGLAVALGALSAVAALVPGLLELARWLPGAGTFLILAGIVLAGTGTGAIFPLAVRATEHEQAAARIYAWDLAGAAGAALLVSLLAIPLLGLFPVAALSAALCAAAALANLVGR